MWDEGSKLTGLEKIQKKCGGIQLAGELLEEKGMQDTCHPDLSMYASHLPLITFRDSAIVRLAGKVGLR